MKKIIWKAFLLFPLSILAQYPTSDAQETTDLFLVPPATKSARQPFNVSGIGYYQKADKAFNAHGNKEALAPFIFIDDMRIADVYLASRLAYEGKITSSDPLTAQQIDFLRRIAPIKLDFCAKHKEIGVELRGSYRFTIPKTKILTTVGLMLPFRRIRHTLLLDFKNVPPDLNINLYDFFVQQIIAPKEMLFIPCLQKKGMGDILGFVGFDFHSYFPSFFTTSEIGLIITFPTSNRFTGIPLWEIQLGTAGGYQYDFYINMVGRTKKWWLNPSFAATVRTSPSFLSIERVAQFKNSLNQVFFPTGFNVSNVTAASFDLPDVRAFYFADRAWCSRYKYGFTGFFIIGNTFKNIFTKKLSANLSYQFFSKNIDTLHVINQSDLRFNTNGPVNSTKQSYHAIIVSFTYIPRDNIEVTLGDQEFVAGKNSFIFHKLFAGFSVSW